MYKLFFKRFLDISLSLIGLIIISPLFLLMWLWLSIANKGAGAFFYQERPGKGGKVFKVIKFKSMVSTHCMALVPTSNLFYLCVELKNRQQ